MTVLVGVFNVLSLWGVTPRVSWYCHSKSRLPLPSYLAVTGEGVSTIRLLRFTRTTPQPVGLVDRSAISVRARNTPVYTLPVIRSGDWSGVALTGGCTGTDMECAGVCCVRWGCDVTDTDEIPPAEYCNHWQRPKRNPRANDRR